MVEIQRILCPVDFSEFSRLALEHAVRFARFFGARIDLLHVTPSRALLETTGWPDAGPMLAEWVDKARTEGRRRLAEAAGPLRDAGLLGSVEVVEGDPARVIVERASASADIVVLGTHGLSGFERLVLGSVTEKVIRRSSRPILTIPNPSGHAIPPRDLLFETVVCGVDFSEASRHALDWAAAVATAANGRLVVVHVVTPPPPATSALDGFDLNAMGTALEREAAERLTAFIPAAIRARVGVEELVRPGSPAKTLLLVASQREAGLLVAGVAPREGLARLIGSTANRLVRSAECPVLSVGG